MNSTDKVGIALYIARYVVAGLAVLIVVLIGLWRGRNQSPRV
jgi:hypothetical protein